MLRRNDFMKTFEYMVSDHLGILSGWSKSTEDDLDKLGSQGWELIGIHGERAILKRENQADPIPPGGKFSDYPDPSLEAGTDMPADPDAKP